MLATTVGRTVTDVLDPALMTVKVSAVPADEYPSMILLVFAPLPKSNSAALDTLVPTAVAWKTISNVHPICEPLNRPFPQAEPPINGSAVPMAFAPAALLIDKLTKLLAEADKDKAAVIRLHRRCVIGVVDSQVYDGDGDDALTMLAGLTLNTELEDRRLAGDGVVCGDGLLCERIVIHVE